MRHVGFLRAVMQGREGLTRDVLLAATRDAGGRDPATHQATGNVSFTSADPAAVAAGLGAAAAAVLGRATPVVVRSLAHLDGWLRTDPFGAAPAATTERLLVLAATDLRPAVDEVTWPDGLTLLGVTGHDAWFARAGTTGAHPMRVLEAAAAVTCTTRSTSTIELVVRAGARDG